ncbi:SPL family radical SAM protein [Proteocatella sphenisci]|uniref:SPL family radical SAM protein n=1 Tax=Proteocatella sphenisci TaxID=181070 RepID=UPI00048D4BC0|nr:radical SAM protein [Proteocatella sphenisci]
MELIEARTIISSRPENGQWFGINYNMNIYKGCSHGCIYCDSRSDCYGVEDFDRVRAKRNALEMIRRELRTKRKKGVVGTGAMSDPYNPLEKEHNLTRGALEIIDSLGFGAAIATKSSLILRDTDILRQIAQHSPVIVKITVTAARDELSRKVEPGVSVSSERFRAIKELSDAGIFAGVLLMPVLPFIEDTEENISKIIELAHKNGAKFIYPAFGVTLRNNQRQWYYRKLDELFPGLKAKYISTYGDSYECRSQNSKKLWALLKSRCDKYGILYRMEDIIREYKKPYQAEQLSFL